MNKYKHTTKTENNGHKDNKRRENSRTAYIINILNSLRDWTWIKSYISGVSMEITGITKLRRLFHMVLLNYLTIDFISNNFMAESQ